ncbi:hypothetical protein QJS10_CPA01g00454 [Acorus calamus]|uniref:Uncharacterized protein n=1 Tax=Acorus calamus TaxID=4465 RepID=A0AAV9FLV1_ACOCL|nr:hypothetical protein QJS10_CPA01g00454 [Acorus calamus]
MDGYKTMLLFPVHLFLLDGSDPGSKNPKIKSDGALFPPEMNGGGKSKKSGSTEAAEVEEMLRAAEDHLLLDISVGSHTTSDNLGPDLSRRFHALRSTPSRSTKTLPKKDSGEKAIRRGGGGGVEDVGMGSESSSLDAELLARFASLKGSGGASGDGGGGGSFDSALPGTESWKVGRSDRVSEAEEVEKVLQWAMDAARLDPSPPTDDDDDGDDDDFDDDNEDVRKKDKHNK